MKTRSKRKNPESEIELPESVEPPLPSPERERRRIENKLLKESWRSPCCGGTATFSKAFLHFTIQAVITLAILTFCMYQLGSQVDPDNTAVYFSMISSMITLYITPPQLGQTRNETEGRE